MRHFYKLILISSITIILAGCFAGPSKPQSKYMFSVNYPSQQRSIDALTLNVHSFQELPQYSSNQFLYRISKYGYLTDYYNIFLVPAASQITYITAKYLMQNSLFAYTSNYLQSQNQADYTLTGTLIALYADYQNSNYPKAIISMHYVLYRNLSDARKVILNNMYTQAVPLKEKSSLALMNAWNTGLQQLLYRLNADVTVAVKRQVAFEKIIAARKKAKAEQAEKADKAQQENWSQ